MQVMKERLTQFIELLESLPSPWGQIVLGGTIFLVVFVVLRVFHFVVLARLRALTKKSTRRIMQILHELLSCISTTSYLAIAVFVAIRIVEGEPGWVTAVSNAFIIVVLTVDLARAAELIIGSGIRFSIRRAGKTPNQSMMNLLQFFVRVVIWALAFLMILSNLGVNVTALVASLGIGGIAVALAVQQVLGDLFNSISLYIDQPFEVGDMITVGPDRGTVERIGLKSTRIRAITGEELVISNSELTKARVQNFRKLQDRRIQFDIGVEYGTPSVKLRKVKEIIKDIVTKEEKTTFQRTHFKKFGDSALIFETVYILHSNDFDVHMDALERINLAIVDAFEKEQIVMAFPTMTVHMSK